MLLLPNGNLDLGTWEFRIPTFEDVFFQEKVEYADITEIIEENSEVNTSGTDFTVDTVKADARELLSAKNRIQYPKENEKVLYTLFKQFDAIKDEGKTMHIIHYGDSQLEGDRISSVLRRKMHQRFGGCGVGLVPVYEVNHSRVTIKTSTSGNWKKYAIYGESKASVPDKKYGLLGANFRFAPYQIDSNNTTEFSGSWTIKKSSLAVGTTQKFTKLQLLYGNNPDTTILTTLLDGEQRTDTLYPTDIPKNHTIPVSKSYDEIKFTLQTKQGIDVYAAYLACNTGVSVTNVAMRGSSGVEFVKMNASNLATQLNSINTKLVILQFGVNVVPNVVSDYSWYESWVYNQIKYFKSLHPDMTVLVVGVSDMATKKGDYFVSYPNVKLIRDAQRNAAFKAGCAFWDLYEAMGGKNSMASWVFAKPPLAAKDFTHFNSRGARIVGEMLFNALMNEYELYRKQ